MRADKTQLYPALHDRFVVLNEAVVPGFEEHDRAALEAQRVHRRYQFALIVGVALTSFFGALQAAANDAPWVGIVLTVLGALAASVANQQRRSKPLSRYLTERAKAEELRSLYFAYLSGADGRDRRTLETDAAAISYSPKERATP